MCRKGGILVQEVIGMGGVDEKVGLLLSIGDFLRCLFGRGFVGKSTYSEVSLSLQKLILSI